MADNNLTKLVESALSNLRSMTEADTVIGAPLEVAGGTVVIPVSKLTVGFTSGGIDYTSKNASDKPPNFGGGTGSGYTVTPIAFLVIDASGDVKLLNIGENSGGGSNLADTITGIAEKAPPIIEKLMQTFKKNKDAKDDKGDGNAEGDSTTLNNDDMNGTNVTDAMDV